MSHKPVDIAGDKSGNKASNSRSDSVDVLHYNIDFDMTNFSAKQITAICRVKLAPKVNNINVLYFDLLKLNVDSIRLGGVHQPFLYNDTLIRISLSSTLNLGDTDEVEIFYHGVPVRDQYWGGFYYSGDYAFNLGVGFDANPHNYGRVWFPCFDNFVERSSFTFNVKTAGGKKAHCNGELVMEKSLTGDTLIRTWQMDEEIPSYLACVAVADYETVRMNHTGVNGTIPIEVAARAPDTTNVKNSFVHLNDAIDAFEAAYGPYLFNKVGYSIVPFNSGAMEHATNIAYPRYAVNGTTNYETLMAHELAHHWWGDLITCREAGDMWLNEGMASYSEHIFLEHTYGQDKYLEAVLNNHSGVLQYAHIREAEYRAISGVPHEYTYGMHVYDKGASVAHNLRAYMGDANFFNGMQSFLSKYRFSDVNSYQFRDELELVSGIGLTDFFHDWVFNPGFPHFSIDSMEVLPNAGNFDVTLHIRQKKRGSPNYFNNVPLELTFWDADFNSITENIMAAGMTGTFKFTLATEPVFSALNVADKINQAVTAKQLMITTTGNHNFNLAKMELNVTSVIDSALVRIEHNWASADPLQQNHSGIELSDYRYWSVDGIWGQDFQAGAVINFDGRSNTSGGEGNLDKYLLRNGEDSLLLFHRTHPGDEWREYRHYTVDNLSSLVDRFGKITIDPLIKGEYVLAKGSSVIGVDEVDKNATAGIAVYPNPARDCIHVVVKEPKENAVYNVELLDMNGKRYGIYRMSGVFEIDSKYLPSGLYLISVNNASGNHWTKTVVVN